MGHETARYSGAIGPSVKVLAFKSRILKEIVAPAMSILSNTPIPPGWYPDPEGSPQQRWWDGSLWTDSVAPYRSVLELLSAATRATEAAVGHPSTNRAFSSSHDFNEQQALATQLSFRSVGSPVADYAPMGTAVPVPAEVPAFLAEVPVVTPASAREIRALEAAVALHGIPVHDRDEFLPLSAAAGSSSWVTAMQPAQEPSSGTSIPDDYEPFAFVQNTRFTAPPSAPPRRTPHLTISAFLLGLLPALLLIAAFGGVDAAPEPYASLIRSVLVALLALTAVLASLLLALRDGSRLRSFGHAHTASSAWVLLSPLVYLVARTVAVRRETGRVSIAPLVVAVSVAGAVAAVLTTQPAFLALLTASIR